VCIKTVSHYCPLMSQTEVRDDLPSCMLVRDACTRVASSTFRVNTDIIVKAAQEEEER